ncbi:TPA: hypothetical protein EYP12_08160, partial [Candidatus Bipolaricaulota bacterium]|nr:hypothetical protein [Candidatus Bipolaricaulota bacterium]
VVVLGKGRYGLVTVPEEVIEALKDQGIEVLVRNTKEACEVYNELVESEPKRVAAALHLTC